MDNNLNHLLSKHKILVAFNIAKKISQSQVKLIRKKLETKFTDPDVLERKVDNEIKNKTRKYLEENEIPGLIYRDVPQKIFINKKIQVKILKLAKKVANYCDLNNFNKDHVIFFVQALLHLLKISNDDMHRFKQKYNIDQDDEDDYLDEDDIDEEE